MRKFNTCALILLTLSFFEMKAQQAEVSDFKLDFAVPDIPAYKILEVESSNLLRPSNFEELTSILSQLTNGSNFILPGSIGVEISPNLLVNRNITLQRYIDSSNEILRTLRFSIASNRRDAENKVTDLGIGIRVSIINEGDYKTDRAFQQELDQILSGLNNQRQRLAEEFRIINGHTANDVANNPDIRALETEFVDNRMQSNTTGSIEALIERYEENNWNAKKLDLAVAIKGTSIDSLADNVEFKQVAAWLTYSNGINNWGQWLFGINYNYDDLINENNKLSFNARLYAGKNRIKGFIEGQYQIESFEDVNSFLLNSGFELNVIGSLWADINFGIESIDSNIADGSDFLSDFNIRYRF